MLIKDAFALENLCKVNAVVFDKTGTLTEGIPQVTDSCWLSGSDEEELNILYTAEQKSEHPLASAILFWLKDSGATFCDADQFKSMTGSGITLVVKGATYWVGSRRLLDMFKAPIPSKIEEEVKQWQEEGQSIALFGKENELLAVFAISDRIKPTSSKAIAILKKQGIEAHLLTGDNRKAAAHVASQLGIEHIAAEVLPNEKNQYIRKLHAILHLQQRDGFGFPVGNLLHQRVVKSAACRFDAFDGGRQLMMVAGKNHPVGFGYGDPASGFKRLRGFVDEERCEMTAGEHSVGGTDECTGHNTRFVKQFGIDFYFQLGGTEAQARQSVARCFLVTVAAVLCRLCFAYGFADAPQFGIVGMCFEAAFVSEGEHFIVHARRVADAKDVDAAVDQLFRNPVYCRVTLRCYEHLVLAVQCFVDGFN